MHSMNAVSTTHYIKLGDYQLLHNLPPSLEYVKKSLLLHLLTAKQQQLQSTSGQNEYTYMYIQISNQKHHHLVHTSICTYFTCRWSQLNKNVVQKKKNDPNSCSHISTCGSLVSSPDLHIASSITRNTESDQHWGWFWVWDQD